jgi:diguanylate cyclase (GGDEF)-like protein/PAS domain S-box-containing protein
VYTQTHVRLPISAPNGRLTVPHVPFPGPFSSTEVLDGLSDGILVTDTGDESRGPRIVYVNPAVCEITGYAADELVGQSPRLLQGPDTDPSVVRQVRHDLDGGRSFNGQAVNYRKDGSSFMMEWSISALVGASGHPEYFVAVQRDVTMPARRLLRAEHAARTDVLTGLPNRSHIDNVLDGGGWLNARAGAAVVVDIDNFKAINDTHGHLVGDEVLRAFAARLTAAVRNGELVARWGGEEFCILIVGAGDRAASVARRIVADISAHPFATSVGELTVTASAGSAEIGAGFQTAQELLIAADTAMYTAKRLGRNRAVTAEPQLRAAG